MINRILQFSIQYRILVCVLGVLLIAAGLYSATKLPIDAVPDVTTNQVQINTLAPAFAPLEMEKYVTFPIEVAMSNLPQKEEIRSISQFGLSQVTITFTEKTDIYWARQMVLERLLEAKEEIPEGISPELAPISTGLGEIYQFTIEADSSVAQQYSLQDLRTLLDWFIKPELRTIPGVVEVNSYGGKAKQYEVRVDPNKLVSHKISLDQIFEALRKNNSNAGGAYIEKAGEQQLLRGVGLIQNVSDIEKIVIVSREGIPIHVADLADVTIGSEIRQGAATRDGKGETVVGMTMLLKGENSRTVTNLVKEKLKEIQPSLPEGIRIYPFADRSELVGQTIHTAGKNLIEGGLLVIAILFLFLMQLRAGLIVSSAIPLSMLFAIIGMNYFGVSANLMSLGAIDFGLIVDGAVIIVENTVRRLAKLRHDHQTPLSAEQRRQTVLEATVEVMKPAVFGMFIIITAYIPILTLGGIEGKMFRPMALSVIFALSGALLLSLTLIPALCAIFLKESNEAEGRFMRFLTRHSQPLLERTLDHPKFMMIGALLFVVGSAALFPLLGSEFLPDLDEGAVAINHVRLKSVSLSETIRQTSLIEKALKELPEVKTVVSRIGRPEIATDPMGPDMADTYVYLKPKSDWRPEVTKEDLIDEMSETMEAVPGVAASFSQPIKFRMMELIEGTGARSDVVVKIFGDDTEQLLRSANNVAAVLGEISGGEDIKVQQVKGLPVMEIQINRDSIANYGINVENVNEVIQSAVAGTKVGKIYEGFMNFDLMVRFPIWAAKDAETIGDLLVSGSEGELIPLRHLARIESKEGPAEISRENAQRLITIEANIRGRDIGSFVNEARPKVQQEVQLSPGYTIEWGGTFEHLESGRNRLMMVVPITFLLIFLLLFTAFHSFKQALIVFTGIPFAVTGGILMLLLRGMHFSMSAGVGFIAVSGVAVLNGVVLI
ncbi:MAG TPA: CusA/CzcA family heavy metal efflux RND transporter, partial [Acidobacteriota bacterium]|nr:CusA/CzcA family heavy metal efflux RND transporter [Acidobacteriota bacterium]